MGENDGYNQHTKTLDAEQVPVIISPKKTFLPSPPKFAERLDRNKKTMSTLIRVPHPLRRQPLSSPPSHRAEHLSSEETAAFLSDNLSYGERELIIQHLQQCQDCGRMVGEIVLSQATVQDVEPLM